MTRSLLVCLALCACSAPPPPASEVEAPVEEVAEIAEQVEAAEPEERTFGQALSPGAVTPLEAITGDPTTFAGKIVKTEGTITQVCQRMGCWMEMQAEGTPPIRVPMAGHSFFLPRDVSGRLATIEGTVALRELSRAEREHLESEGATATAQALQITASGVIVR